MEVKLTSANFENEVLKSEKPVLVDFWATWCGPCQMLGPVLEEISKENDDIKIGKVNVDEENELAVEYKVVSIPYLVLFKDGVIIKKTVGYQSKEQVLDFINGAIKN